MDHDQDRSPQGEEELRRTQELLERTVRFLAQCMEDPTAAMASEDPRALIQGLRSLAVEPTRAESKEKEPRTIQIRHRRSA